MADPGTAVATLTLTPFVPDDLMLLRARAGRVSHERLEQQAWTLRDDEGVVCCFGLTSPWPGYARVWCEERDPATMQHYRHQVGRVLWQHWQECIVDSTYRRVDACVPQTHTASRQMVEAMGFHLVAVKPHYGPEDETMVEYVYYPRGLD
jgi:hypothetical protein